MMDQDNASSRPALVNELLKRHLDNGSNPKLKVKIKMELPKAGLKCPDCGKVHTGACPTPTATNQWKG